VTHGRLLARAKKYPIEWRRERRGHRSTALAAPASCSYGGYESAIISTAGDRAWMMSSWATRTNANLGCYDNGEGH